MISISLSLALAASVFAQSAPAPSAPSGQPEITAQDAVKKLWDNGAVPDQSKMVGWFAGRGFWASTPNTPYGAIVVGFMAPGQNGEELRLLPLHFPQQDFYDKLDERKIKAIRQDMASNVAILPKPEIKSGALTMSFNSINAVCAKTSADPQKDCIFTTRYELKVSGKSFVAKVSSRQVPGDVYLYYYLKVTPPEKGQPGRTAWRVP